MSPFLPVIYLVREGKAKVSLCLAKHHAMKTYWGSGDTATRVLNLGIAQSVQRLGYGLGILLFTTVSRKVLGPTQLPSQWVPGALSLGVKRTGREADYSPP